MDSGSPSDPWDLRGKAKLSYVHDKIGKVAKLWSFKLILVFHHLPSVGPKQLCALEHLGYARKVDTSYT